MEKLLIVGAGGFGRVVLEHACEIFGCSFVDDGIEIGSEVCGAKVVGTIPDLEALFLEYKLLVVSIGNNKLREHIYRKAKAIGYSFPNIEGRNVYISPYARVGSGCVFLNNVNIQNSSVVGNGVILNPGVEIHHDSFVDDYSLIYTNTVIRTYAKVGKRVKLGSNVTISNEMIVEDDAIIDDGKTVDRSIRACGL